MGGRPDPTDPIALAQALIRRPSVTPADAGALDVAQDALAALGFACRRLPFASPGAPRIENLYARLGDGQGRLLCFAGHTDVVPPGDPAAWTHDPFGAVIADGRLYGRGAADMKGAVAAFIAAAGRFARRRQGGFGGAIGVLLTGDEEGDAIDGTRRVLAALAAEGERLDACIVGEPSNPDALGDMIKIGRRGSMTADLTVHGVQGHTAYPHLADNPLHRLVRMLEAVTHAPLDDGSAHFGPSNLEITTIDVGNPANNVIPARGSARINIRFNDRHDAAGLEAWLRSRFDAFGGRYDMTVRVSGESFLTPPGPFTELVAAAVERITGRRPEYSTSGGTSDARFIKDYCPVVELGLVNRTIHQVDEHAALADIAGLTDIYEAILESYFAGATP